MAKTRIRPRARRAPRPTYQPLYLVEWLKLFGKTQRQAAEATGISESHLSLIASGKRQFTQENLEKLAAFLGIDRGMLLYPATERPIGALLGAMTADERARAARVLRAMVEDKAP